VVVVEVLKACCGETAAAVRSGVAVGYMFPEQREAATRLAIRLRAEGNRVDLSLAPQKPKAFFSRAGSGTAAHAVFIGPDDLSRGHAKLKNLETRDESEIALAPAIPV
jgi:histidyl-tRNA synthetase